MKNYPDVSEIFQKKAAHRRALAALSFEEKIELVFKMRERREFIKTGKLIAGETVTGEKVADKTRLQGTD